uniref:Uncharacterized protein n=1 Tax=Triticum urartu TaxID=4572 RepID=A0A8R7TNN3_TRIUA
MMIGSLGPHCSQEKGMIMGLLWPFKRPNTYKYTSTPSTEAPTQLRRFVHARHWCLAVLPKSWKSHCSANLAGISLYCRLHRNYI